MLPDKLISLKNIKFLFLSNSIRNPIKYISKLSIKYLYVNELIYFLNVFTIIIFTFKNIILKSPKFRRLWYTYNHLYYDLHIQYSMRNDMWTVNIYGYDCIKHSEEHIQKCIKCVYSWSALNHFYLSQLSEFVLIFILIKFDIAIHMYKFKHLWRTHTHHTHMKR